MRGAGATSETGIRRGADTRGRVLTWHSGAIGRRRSRHFARRAAPRKRRAPRALQACAPSPCITHAACIALRPSMCGYGAARADAGRALHGAAVPPPAGGALRARTLPAALAQPLRLLPAFQVLDQCDDQLATFPRSTKAALLASLRLRFAGVDAAESEVDRCVLSLTDESQTTLDLSGLPVSDAAAVALAPKLARLRALDVRRCSLLTGKPLRAAGALAAAEACDCAVAAQGLRELLAHTTELRVLRWGMQLACAHLRVHCNSRSPPLGRRVCSQRPRGAGRSGFASATTPPDVRAGKQLGVAWSCWPIAPSWLPQLLFPAAAIPRLAGGRRTQCSTPRSVLSANQAVASAATGSCAARGRRSGCFGCACAGRCAPPQSGCPSLRSWHSELLPQWLCCGLTFIRVSHSTFAACGRNQLDAGAC